MWYARISCGVVEHARARGDLDHDALAHRDGPVFLSEVADEEDSLVRCDCVRVGARAPGKRESDCGD